MPDETPNLIRIAADERDAADRAFRNHLTRCGGCGECERLAGHVQRTRDQHELLCGDPVETGALF